MSELTQKLTLEAMRILLAARVPVLLWGDPGIGKTTTIERYAHAAGWATETVIASLHDPTDIGGLPVLTPDGVVTRAARMGAAHRRTRRRHAGVLRRDQHRNPRHPERPDAHRALSGQVGDLDLGPQSRASPPPRTPRRTTAAPGTSPRRWRTGSRTCAGR